MQPDDKLLNEQEDVCLKLLEEAGQAGEQWVNDELYENDHLWKQFASNSTSELDWSSQSLDLRGTLLFQNVLVDPQCKLTVLKLDGVKLGCDGIKHLARGIAGNETLEVLSLVGCYIRAFGAQCIAHALFQNKGLAEIDLSKNGIGSRGLGYLCGSIGIAENTSLMKLVLSNNRIGDSEAAKLGQTLQVLLTR